MLFLLPRTQTTFSNLTVASARPLIAIAGNNINSSSSIQCRRIAHARLTERTSVVHQIRGPRRVVRRPTPEVNSLLRRQLVTNTSTTTPSPLAQRRTYASSSNTTAEMASNNKSLPKSMVAHQLASPSALESNLKLNQVAAVPSLKKNQTLIKVLSAGLNPIDYKIPEIPFVARLAVGFPHTPATDFVGRVWDTTLPESEGFKGGDLVFGKLAGPSKVGTLGEYTIVSGTDGLVHCPEGVSELDWFAGVGVAGVVAYQCLGSLFKEAADSGSKTQSVFINGGSGGAGTFGIQIAKHVLGCRVVTSCSGSNASLCRELGADQVIDYRSQNVVEGLKKWVQSNGGKKLDLIVDNVGADPDLYWQCGQYLKEGGQYAQIGAAPSLKATMDLTKMFLWPRFLGGGQRSLKFVMLKPDRDALVKFGQWMKEGKVKVVIDETFEMSDAAKAFERLKTGRARGKVIVRVSEDGRGNG